MVPWEQPALAQQPGQAQPAAQQPATAPAPARRRDEGLRAKKLPCGHILHLRCLKSWLERQQVCPTCRRPVVVATDTATRVQQGARGAGQPAQGQQAGQAARRPGRARIFNFGPIRVGFLNGPGHQLGNIVRQMQNLNQVDMMRMVSRGRITLACKCLTQADSPAQLVVVQERVCPIVCKSCSYSRGSCWRRKPLVLSSNKSLRCG